jgi:arylamine N-acetyltransferase
VAEVEGRSWLVDCGNGAPFGEPIPLDEPYELHRAGLSYRFRSEDGVCVQYRLIEGEWRPFCRYDLSPASDAEREAAYQRHHRLPAESFVVEELRIVRVLGDAVLQLGNRQFTRHTPDGRSRRELSSVEEYVRVLADEFELPGLPIREGLAAWWELTGQGPEG